MSALALEELSSIAHLECVLRPYPHLRPAPAFEPPFDDEPAAARPALTLVPSLAEESGAPDPTMLRPGFDDLFGPQPTPRSALPDPEPITRRLTQAMLEAMTGRRPWQQLARHLHPDLYLALTAARSPASQRAAGAAHAARVLSVRCGEPVDGVAEAAAVVRERDRVYAVALRLEGIDGAWRCVNFDIV